MNGPAPLTEEQQRSVEKAIENLAGKTIHVEKSLAGEAIVYRRKDGDIVWDFHDLDGACIAGGILNATKSSMRRLTMKRL